MDLIGYTAALGDGPAGSARIAGVTTGGWLAIGGSIVPGLAIAGELGGDTASSTFHGGPFGRATIATPGSSAMVPASNQADGSLVAISLLVDWFPNPARGWHFGGSIGIGGIGVINHADGSDYSGGPSFTGGAFGGYDFWLGPGWALGLAVSARAQPQQSLTDFSNGGVDTGYRLTPVSAVLQASLLFY